MSKSKTKARATTCCFGLSISWSQGSVPQVYCKCFQLRDKGCLGLQGRVPSPAQDGGIVLVSKVCAEVFRSALGLSREVVFPECPCGVGDADDCPRCVSSCRLVKEGSTVFSAHESPVKEFMLLDEAVSSCERRVAESG